MLPCLSNSNQACPCAPLLPRIVIRHYCSRSSTFHFVSARLPLPKQQRSQVIQKARPARDVFRKHHQYSRNGSSRVQHPHHRGVATINSISRSSAVSLLVSMTVSLAFAYSATASVLDLRYKVLSSDNSCCLSDVRPLICIRYIAGDCPCHQNTMEVWS
jgi:hypothetical protein